MIDVMTALLGPELRQWANEVMRAAGALPPALTGAIALPVIVAVAVRSIMALAVTTLIASAAITVLSFPGQIEHRWAIVQVICLAGFLAAVAGGLHRRSRNKLREVASELAAVQTRLSETSEKYEREVQWRQAAGRSGVSWGELLPPAASPSRARG
jgi:hypothetical protein